MKIADDAESIRRRMEEIQAERMQQIIGKPIEETAATPADIDWTGLYGKKTPVGYMRNLDGRFVKISAVDAAFGYVLRV